MSRNKRKERNQRFHAKMRALERYGVDLSHAEMDAMVKRIQNGEGKFLGRDSLRISHFQLDQFKVVYDRLRKVIVTFLPPDAEFRGT